MPRVETVDQYGKEPTSEIGSRLKRREPLASGERGLLHEVLGVRGILCQPKRVAIGAFETRDQQGFE